MRHLLARSRVARARPASRLLYVLAFPVFLVAACGGAERPALSTSSPSSASGTDASYTFASDDPFGEGDNAIWTEVLGGWQVRSGRAEAVSGVETTAKGTVALATVPVGSSDALLQVRLPTVGNQAGLVFRFSNPENYWFVAAAPDFASWGVVKVVDGERESVGDIGLAPVADRTTVGVLLDGSDITVLLNGRVVDTLSDATHIDAASAGLFVGGNVAESTASFDDFEVRLSGEIADLQQTAGS